MNYTVKKRMITDNTQNGVWVTKPQDRFYMPRTGPDNSRIFNRVENYMSSNLEAVKK